MQPRTVKKINLYLLSCRSKRSVVQQLKSISIVSALSMAKKTPFITHSSIYPCSPHNSSLDHKANYLFKNQQDSSFLRMSHSPQEVKSSRFSQQEKFSSQPRTFSKHFSYRMYYVRCTNTSIMLHRTIEGQFVAQMVTHCPQILLQCELHVPPCFVTASANSHVLR